MQLAHRVITRLNFTPIKSLVDSMFEQSENVAIALFLVTAAVGMQ